MADDENQSAGRRAAVIGGGTMGAGIAQVLLEAGCAVVVVEADGDAAERARARVADGLARRKDVAPGEVEARLDKESIEVRDSPGFATSRLGVCLGLEAIRMVEEGVASASDIDQGMVLGYRHPMGPLRLTDLVGLDVRLNIAEHLATTLGPRFEPPALLREKVAAGELGKKAGRGFYDWS